MCVCVFDMPFRFAFSGSGGPLSLALHGGPPRFNVGPPLQVDVQMCHSFMQEHMWVSVSKQSYPGLPFEGSLEQKTLEGYPVLKRVQCDDSHVCQ